jgi:hypothetical protein
VATKVFAEVYTLIKVPLASEDVPEMAAPAVIELVLFAFMIGGLVKQVTVLTAVAVAQ